MTTCIRDILSRRAPDGSYVILAKSEALPLIEQEQVEIEVLGKNLVAVKTKSRSLAEKLARRLARKKLLAM